MSDQVPNVHVGSIIWALTLNSRTDTYIDNLTQGIAHLDKARKYYTSEKLCLTERITVILPFLNCYSLHN